MNKLNCEKSAKERLKESWREGMLYRFYKFLTKHKKKKMLK